MRAKAGLNFQIRNVLMIGWKETWTLKGNELPIYFTIECVFDFVLDCLSGIKRMRTGECENVCLNESECLFVTKLVNWMVNECKKVNAKMFNAVNETAVWINKIQNKKHFCFY